MKKFVILPILFFVFQLVAAYGSGSSDSLTVAPFGKVFIYKQTPVPARVAILISGDGGWKSGVVSFAQAFSEMNTLVIGVDILRYFKQLRSRPEECYTIASDFVELATAVEKKYNFNDYIPPVIMGYSSGATLVYGILAQARPGTFAGGISLGFCPDIELPKMLCQINGLTEKDYVPGKSYMLQPDEKLGNRWIVLQGMLDKVCNFDEVAAFVKRTADAELISLPKVGHGFSKWNDFMPQWKDAFIKLNEKTEKAEASTVRIEELKDLPLIITASKVQNTDAPVAFLISGDGGWYGFEQAIADNLAKIGISTIGLDSKKYFWKRRSPDETAIAVTKALKYYGKEWGKEQYMLIGYSLGAEIVPFIITRIPDEIKSKIKSAVLLSPETTTDFEIHISNMLGMGNHQNTYNVTDEITRMQPVHTLIIFGDGEKSKIQKLMEGTSIKVSLIPGDHHYKFNLPLIIQTMKDNEAF